MMTIHFSNAKFEIDFQLWWFEVRGGVLLLVQKFLRPKQIDQMGISALNSNLFINKKLD